MILCSSLDRAATVVHEPVVVFEIISPSTTRIVRLIRVREHQAAPSVQRHVMLEQDSIGATVCARAGAVWTHEIVIAYSSLSLLEVEVELPLVELYDGLTFEADPQPEFDHS